MKKYKTLLVLAFPMMVQNLLHSSLSLIDTFMIGQLGDRAIASVGIAGQLFFVFFVLQFGIHSGISVHTSQHWGKKNIVTIRQLLGVQMGLGIMAMMIFLFIIYAVPMRFISLYTDDPLVASEALSYMKITGFSLFFSVVAYAYTFNLRSTEIVRPPLWSSLISVISNLILNYLLIFGKMGFPELGIVGAAVGTTISRGIECAVLVFLVYKGRFPSAAGIKEMTSFSYSFVKGVVKVSWPVFMNEFSWVLGISVYNWAYSSLGTESLAAVNIVSSIENFLYTPFFGIFGAGAVIMGNKIGEGKTDEAYIYGKSILFFQFSLASLTGLFLYFFRPIILSFYSISSQTVDNAAKLLIVISAVMALKICNYTFNVSIFRGGGDTKYSLFLDLSGVWMIGVPMALLGVFLFRLPVHLVMSLVVCEEVYKILLAQRRFRNKKWIKVLV